MMTGFYKDETGKLYYSDIYWEQDWSRQDGILTTIPGTGSTPMLP